LRAIARGAAVQTRSGNTSEPDASWSDWQAPASNDVGDLAVASPAARYLQYRLQLQNTSASADDAAAFSRLDISYRAANSTPTVDLATPQGGEYWMGKKKITWSGKDPDSDALLHRAFITSDNGNTWQPLGDAPAKDASFEIDTTKYSDGTYRAKVVTSDALANPEDPREAQDISLPFVIDNGAPQLQVVLLPDGDGWKLLGVGTDAVSPVSGGEWRFVAIPEKPAGAVPAPAAAIAVAVAATATTAPSPIPDLDAAPPSTATPGGTGAASTPATPKPSLKDGDWRALAPVDGIFDSRREALIALLPSALLPKAPEGMTATAKNYRVEVRLFDAAGNRVTQTFDLP
jgi:hypothetical protein